MSANEATATTQNHAPRILFTVGQLRSGRNQRTAHSGDPYRGLTPGARYGNSAVAFAAARRYKRTKVSFCNLYRAPIAPRDHPGGAMERVSDKDP